MYLRPKDQARGARRAVGGLPDGGQDSEMGHRVAGGAEGMQDESRSAAEPPGLWLALQTIPERIQPHGGDGRPGRMPGALGHPPGPGCWAELSQPARMTTGQVKPPL